MFNVTIINAKGSIKKIAILIVTLILLFIVTRFIQNLKSTEVFKINLSSKLVNCLNNEIPAINEIVSKSNTTIKEEISTWDVSDKKVAQVYKLAYRYIAEKSVDR